MKKNYKYRLVKFEQLGFETYWAIEWKTWFGWIRLGNIDGMETGIFYEEKKALEYYERKINSKNPINKSVIETNDTILKNN